MPLYWHYLLKDFLKVLLLATLSFIAFLLVSRLEEIARFVTLGTSWRQVLQFVAFQIPYILPIALPLSALLSAYLLLQRLSKTHELIALRATGFSFLKILSPLLTCALLLSFTCFYITSELATTSHLKCRQMIYRMSAENPLLLLQNAKSAQLENAFIEMHTLENGKSAKNVKMAFPSENGLSLLLADTLSLEENETLQAKRLSLVTTLDQNEQSHLAIENQQEMSAHARELAYLIRQKGWRLSTDHLKWSLLKKHLHVHQLQNNRKVVSKCYSEMVRRFAMGLSAFSFTLMGASLGMRISRTQGQREIILLILMTTLTLTTFFIAKNFEKQVALASTFYLMPHILMIALSFFSLYQLEKGRSA